MRRDADARYYPTGVVSTSCARVTLSKVHTFISSPENSEWFLLLDLVSSNWKTFILGIDGYSGIVMSVERHQTYYESLLDWENTTLCDAGEGEVRNGMQDHSVVELPGESQQRLSSLICGNTCAPMTVDAQENIPNWGSKHFPQIVYVCSWFQVHKSLVDQDSRLNLKVATYIPILGPKGSGWNGAGSVEISQRTKE
ncbi:hypothetical protein WN55_06713 [Dufourea novaeangliae]|uniref:Uncharacterized protein n=1 Tax=Dufourea novaeangliae TaxID=178035 RepID=A0A154PSD3_DUFNO|nr:hypothetical protein WN55_06713 [Dufourea novaeangliae]